MKDFSMLLNPWVALRLVLRYRWIIMTPVLVASIVGIYLCMTMSRVYEANTLILVEPQRVPQNYVKSVVSSNIDQRISTISQQILSRTNLERIINEFDLFQSEEQKKMFSEDKIQSLRNRINVRIINQRRGGDAFSISFRGQDPNQVVKIANTLASYFIDENLKVRESQALGTSDFLNNELDIIRKKLESVELAMQDYRRTYMGELPEQLETNLNMLKRNQEQLNIKEENLRNFETQLADLKREIANSQENQIGFDIGISLDGSGSESSELEAQLDRLLLKYTDKHPDVVRLKKMIEAQKAKQKEKEENGAIKESDPAGITDLRGDYIKQSIDQLNSETAKTKAQIKELESKIALYQERIDNTPKREQEMLSLNRDYDNIKSAYQSMLNRKLEAEISVNMERKQKGEQFRIIDTAKLPEKPISPNVKMIFLSSLILGLALGLGIPAILEYFDHSYQTEGEIESELNIKVLATVPFLRSSRDIVLSRINNIASLTVAVSILLLVSAFYVSYSVGFEKIMIHIKRVIA